MIYEFDYFPIFRQIMHHDLGLSWGLCQPVILMSKWSLVSGCSLFGTQLKLFIYDTSLKSHSKLDFRNAFAWYKPYKPCFSGSFLCTLLSSSSHIIKLTNHDNIFINRKLPIKAVNNILLKWTYVWKLMRKTTVGIWSILQQKATFHRVTFWHSDPDQLESLTNHCFSQVFYYVKLKKHTCFITC